MVPRGAVTAGIRGGRPRLRGDSTLKPRTEQSSAAAPPAPQSAQTRKRVLFICIGNSCRSQMAEAFARAYGSDILAPFSAGLAPAGIVQKLTRQVLTEKNIPSEGQFPKALDAFSGEPFEIVVNMSGENLPRLAAGARHISWRVRDPIGQTESVYRAVCNEIEGLVMRLILELRGT